MHLTAFDMPRLRALDAASDLAELRALVAASPNLGTEAERKKAAARLAKLRETDAPDVMIRAEAHAADPRQAALDAIDRGERPVVLDFAEAARLAIDDRDLLWVLDAAAFAAGGRRKFESEAHRHVWGSTRLEIDGRRLFPHWRSLCGWSEELLDQAKAHVGPTWDVNWHDDAGVAAARDYFAEVPRRSPPGVEHARHLDAVLERTSMGFEVPDWELPWLVAEALTRVRKQLAALEKFYARCTKRRWQVLTGPTDL